MTEGSHHLFPASEFIEGLCLPLKKGNEGLERVTRLELMDEWMLVEIRPRPVLVFLPGGLKEYLKNRRFRSAHTTGIRLAGCSGSGQSEGASGALSIKLSIRYRQTIQMGAGRRQNTFYPPTYVVVEIDVFYFWLARLLLPFS
jgi:hypothetical protein